MSTNPKHTPGPWKVYDQAEDEGKGDCSISCSDPNADWIAQEIPIRADARLISAAPELLEACKLLRAECQDDAPHNQNEYYERAVAAYEAAIAKAEGRG